MTQKANIDIDLFIKGLHEYIAQAFRPVIERLTALEQQDAKTLADSYKGAWLPGKYARGSLTTHAGSLWLARRPPAFE
mgnify:CR=1 FL=1